MKPGDIGVIQSGAYKGTTVIGCEGHNMIGLNDPANLLWTGLKNSVGYPIRLLPSKTQIILTVK